MDSIALVNPKNLQLAADHLVANDPILAPVIKTAGLATLAPHNDYYGALISSIIGQQISTKAAAAVKGRLMAKFGGQLPSPEQIMTLSPDDLRAIGFSYPKARYVIDLAQHIDDGRITFATLSEQTNQEIISELTDVKGIGEWTVHMFLMFSVGRLDILPTGDMGVRSGIRKLYGLAELPTPAEVTAVAQKYNWHPYESIASWYVWRSFDTNPVL